MLDVIICGAGVAGSRVAKMLGDKIKYKIFDPGKIYLKDSGSVSTHIKDFFPKIKIERKIKKIIIRGEKNSITFKRDKPFAYLINRISFWKMLRKGLDIEKERILEVKQHKNFVSVKTNENKYKAKLVVGADGALSIVRRELGIRANIYFGIFGFSKPKSNAYVVHFNKKFSNGFSWQIPNGEYGLITSNKFIKKSFEDFLSSINTKIKKYYSYPLPLGLQKSYSRRVILVGDAASQIKPITFGGIIYSLKTANIAARHIKNFLADEVNYNLKNYEDDWRKEFGDEIFFGSLFRKMYEAMPQKMIDLSISFMGNFKNKIESKDFDYDMMLRSVLKS